MSRVNFESLAAKRPDLSAIWTCIQEWFHHHPRIKFIELRRLAKSCKGASAEEIADAIELMVEEGLLRRAYRIETPDGNLLDEEYHSLKEIPKQATDLSGPFTFDTFKEGSVVSGFHLEAARGKK